MSKGHAHFAHMAKHMNMVGNPSLVGALGPAPLGPPQSGAGSPATWTRKARHGTQIYEQWQL